MKKIYLALMCAAGLTMMTACGGGDKDKTEKAEAAEPTEAKEEQKEGTPERYDPEGLGRCAKSLKDSYGISLKQIEPDFDFEEVVAGWDKFEGGPNMARAVYKKKGGGVVSRKEFEVWARKMFALTKTLADDGRNILGYDGVTERSEEEAKSEVTFDQVMADGGDYPSWSFLTNGEWQTCYLGYEGDDEPFVILLRLGVGLPHNLDKL